MVTAEVAMTKQPEAYMGRLRQDSGVKIGKDDWHLVKQAIELHVRMFGSIEEDK